MGRPPLEILDKSKPLKEYDGTVVRDDKGNLAVVCRHWKGDLVTDKEPSYSQFNHTVAGFKGNSLGYSSHYENIVYLEGYLKPLNEDFNEDDELKIIGTANEAGSAAPWI